MFGLCKYKDIFGKPNTEIHSYRIFNIAYMDVLFTIIAGVLISYSFNYSLINVLIVLFLIGIVMHYIFCVKTTVNNFIFNQSL